MNATPRSGRLRAVLLSLGALGLFVAGAFLIAELAVRRLDSRPYQPRMHLAFERNPYRILILQDPAPRGVAVPSVRSTNRWAMRGEDPPRNWSAWDTWIAVGSSTTQCWALDDARTWPARLQARLREMRPRTWVGNAGQDGVSSLAMTVLAEDLVRTLRPKGLFFMPGQTDMLLSLSDDRRRKGSPYDAAGLRRLERLRAAREEKTWPGRLERNLRLAGFAAAWHRRHTSEPRVIDAGQHKSAFPPPLEAPEDILPSPDTLLPSLSPFRENLRRIGAAAESAGIRVVFLTQPLLYGTDSAWQARVGREVRIEGRDYRISAATQRRLLDRFNSELLATCAAEGWECVDLSSRIPPDSLLFYDDRHFTDAGAALAADVVADYLLRK